MNKHLPPALLNLLSGAVILSVTPDWGIWSVALYILGGMILFAGFIMLFVIAIKRTPNSKESDPQ